MALILHIETSTTVCSVAVSENEKLLFYKEDTKGPSHASILGVFVQQAVEELKKYAIKPDAVTISAGPGSYTGLRIGVSEAKGLCYGWGIPLIAIETLSVLAFRLLHDKVIEAEALLCPMIDARRMEVYTCLLDTKLEKIEPTTASIIDESFYQKELENQKIYFFGNGAMKCSEVITSDNAIFVDGVYPRACDMVELANDAFASKQFVDVAYYEPFYLKEFVGTIPKNKVLG